MKFFIGLFVILNLNQQIRGLYYFIEAAEFDVISEEWFDVEKSKFLVSSVNDTFNTVDIKLVGIKNMPENIFGYFNLFYKSMDEYSISSGLEISMLLCDWLEDRVMMGHLINAVGISSDNCPPKAGIYEVKSYYPPGDGIPRNIPASNGRLIFGMSIGDEKILQGSTYIEFTD